MFTQPLTDSWPDMTVRLRFGATAPREAKRNDAMSTPDGPRGTHQATILARYTDLTWHPLVQQTQVPAAALDAFTAAALHIAPHNLTAFRASFAHTRRSFLHQLLNDASLTELLMRLPSILGQRVAVIGDSISADALSWANLFKDLVIGLHPHVHVTNNSLTGRTTAEGIPALADALKQEPTHVFTMLGVNDIRRYGTHATVTMTSMAEVRRNLVAILAMANEAGVTATLITPPPTAPSSTQTLWTRDDFDDLENLVLDVDPDAINLRGGSVGSRDYWLADGVHPTPVGQNDILRSMLNALEDRPEAPSEQTDNE